VQATLALEEGVTVYARFLWDHLGREEGVILPAAQRFLLAEDWGRSTRPSPPIATRTSTARTGNIASCSRASSTSHPSEG
jgi:hypothetical protein